MKKNGTPITPLADYLFEVSWEVCNKVGGINTVLKSKAALMKESYKNYLLIGPYFEQNAVLEFEEHSPPPFLAKSFKELKKSGGIKCHYGTWQIKGEPDTILIEFSSLIAKKNEMKSSLWENYRIDSLNTEWDFEEPMIFSVAVAMLLSAIEQKIGKDKGLVAHFHEWLAGLSLLFLKEKKTNIKTVFTTHATMLGRSICGAGGELYENLESIDPVGEAYNHRVEAKHLTEVACAKNCEVFTTVSEITAIEAEHLLGRKPDVLVLNGLDISRFPTFEETSIKHVTCRGRLRDFLTYYFFPYYFFPLNHNLMFFITGRFEFKNKGIDLTVKALGRLNQLLKESDGDRTVTIFFWIPMARGNTRIELLENKNYYYHIKNYIQYNSDSILKKILYDFIANKDIEDQTLFTKQFLDSMKKDILQFKRVGNPPLSTNYIPDEDKNELVRALKEEDLDNKADDRVKVIIHPVYLDGNDGLFNLSYYDAIAGTHLGLFPSYYEPWGYTPLETAAMGVSSLTTDLAGFGRFIESHLDEKNPGIRVLHRYQRPEKEVVEEFAQKLFDFSQLNHQDRVQNKLSAKRLSSLCDWKEFISNYIKAHNLALKR